MFLSSSQSVESQSAVVAVLYNSLRNGATERERPVCVM